MSVNSQPDYISPEKRREVYQTLQQSCIKFNEPNEPMQTSQQYWHHPPQLEKVNSASVIAEVNALNSNKQRVLIEKYKGNDYAQELKRQHDIAHNTPNTQYQQNMKHAKNMKLYEQATHSMKTLQPAKKTMRFKKLKRMSLQEMADLSPTHGSVKDIEDRLFLNRVLDKIEGFNSSKKIFRQQRKSSVNHHFKFGTSRNLSKHLIGRNSCPVLTSTTSIHTPLKQLPFDHEKILELKKTLKNANGVEKLFKVPSANKIMMSNSKKIVDNASCELSPSSVNQRKTKVIVTNKKLKSLYGSLKKASSKTNFTNGPKDIVKTSDLVKLQKSLISKLKKNKSINYDPRTIFDTKDVEFDNTFLKVKQEKVSTILNKIGTNCKQIKIQ